jgi:exodeoxyribonuclease X
MKDPEPIEVGYIDLLDGAETNIRLQPSKPIEYGALATHHIMDEDLEGCPPSAGFSLPPKFTHMIGHNVFYDWEVIGKPVVKLICTHALARDLWWDLDSYSLGALTYYLDRGNARRLLKGAHSALADCSLAAELLEAICTVMGLNMKDPALWDVLATHTETARRAPFIGFGKHKGLHYDLVPDDYKNWYFRQADQDPIVVDAMKHPRLYDIMGRRFPARRD